MLVAIVHAPLGQAVCFAIDCAAVLYRFRNLVSTVWHTSTHAGLWGQISEAEAGREIAVRKVKAHISEAKAVGKDDLEDLRGSDWADTHAKHIAREASLKEVEVMQEKD